VIWGDLLIEHSFFIGLAVRIWLRLTHYFKHSVVGGFFVSVSRFFGNGWRNSCIHNWLVSKSVFEKGFEVGMTGRFFMSFSSFLWFKKTTATAVEKSRIISTIAAFCNSIIHISLRSFGVMFVWAGGVAVLFSFAVNGEFSLIFAAILVFGVTLMLLNRSFAQLCNGSLLLKKAAGFFFIDPQMLEDKEVKRYTDVFVVLGIVFGAIGFFGGIIGFVVALGGVFGGLLVLHRVEVGIFTASFFAPILPTMLIIGLAGLTIVSFGLKWIFSGKTTVKFSYIDLFVVIFAAVVAFGLVVTYNFSSSLPVAAVYLLFITFYFVVKNTINTREKLLAAVATIATSGLLVALFGIYQRITGNFGMTASWIDSGMFGTVDRIYSTLENPNVLGGYLIFIVIISFAMLYYYKDTFHKLVALGIFGIAGLCIIFTHSRGAWLGLLVAVAVFALVRERRLIWLGIIGLIFAPFVLPPEILERFLSIGDMADTSTSYRVSIWMGSVDLLRVFWPSGIGQGVENFNFIYNLFALSAAFTQHTHMLYLQIMVYWGIVGIGLFILIMTGFFKGLMQAVANADNSIKTIAAALIAAMVGYMVKGFTDNVWYNFRIFAFFWIIIALGAALASIAKEKRSV